MPYNARQILQEPFGEPHQSIFIPKKTKHRLANNHKNNLIIIEVWHGNILKEDDIVRYEDIYERDLT